MRREPTRASFGLQPALQENMDADYLRFSELCEEQTLEFNFDTEKKPSFKASVPAHLTKEFVAHWDTGMLWE